MNPEIKQDGEFKYIEEGQGNIILVLHGLFGALSNFKDVFAEFGKTHRVIIPMLPIYDLPITSTSVKSLAKFVRDFVNHMGFDKVNLLGNSLGGHIALVYTSEHINKVNSLILTGSSGLYENAMGGSFPRREDYDFIKAKVGETFYDPNIATKELVDECFEIVNDRGRLVRILALAKSAIRHNMAKEIPNMNVPACLIWGKNDTITPPHVGEEFEQLLPDADLYWIDKCGHAPMMEHPQEFNAHLRGWLTKRNI